jgi:hypothetical protein
MKHFLLAAVLLLLVLATSVSATSPNSEPNDDYELQSLLWEHDAIFNSVLEWAQQKGVLTASQASTLQTELETRLKALAANEGSDVDGTICSILYFTTQFSLFYLGMSCWRIHKSAL